MRNWKGASARARKGWRWCATSSERRDGRIHTYRTRHGGHRSVSKEMRLCLALLLSIVVAGAQTATFDNISATNGAAMLSPGSIAIATGTGLAANEVIGAMQAPLETTLGGISVQVV